MKGQIVDGAANAIANVSRKRAKNQLPVPTRNRQASRQMGQKMRKRICLRSEKRGSQPNQIRNLTEQIREQTYWKRFACCFKATEKQGRSMVIGGKTICFLSLSKTKKY
jgi:hypothetical protein